MIKHLIYRSFSVLVLITAVVVAVQKENEEDGSSLESLAKKYAPFVYQPKGERFYPSSVDYFLKYARMTGSNKRYTRRTLPRGKNSYHLSVVDADLKKIERGERDLDRVPVYAIVAKSASEIEIKYWTFYPYNKGKRVCKKTWFKRVCTSYFGNHVGDFEHVEIRLNARDHSPVSLTLSAHGDSTKFTWNGNNFSRGRDTIRMYGTHSKVYAAYGSHGLWPKAGSHDYKCLLKIFGKCLYWLTDHTSSGAAWKTWKSVQVIQQKEFGSYTGGNSWLNFKGRWGNKERGCNFKIFGKKFIDVCQQENGPKGPAAKY